MKIFKDSIVTLASEGRITLQIPQYNIWMENGPHHSEIIEAPDDWVILLKSNNTPAVGKESGFWFLTKKGWEENKNEIKKAFLSSNRQRGTWDDFELHAEEHFIEVEIASKKRIAYLEKKLEQAREYDK